MSPFFRLTHGHGLVHAYVAPKAPCVVLLPKQLSGILIAMSLARPIRVALVGGDREPTARFTELGVSSA